MATALIERVTEVYRTIQTAVEESPDFAGKCRACGKCCNFKSFDHLLYITPPEIKYLVFNIGGEKIKPMSDGICPYNSDGKCTIYDYRFASCRIFCCTGDRDFQSRLTESALAELKRLCSDLLIPYRYVELSIALNECSRRNTQNA